MEEGCGPLRQPTGFIKEGCPSHLEAALTTLSLRDKGRAAYEEVVRGQRDVRNGKDGREREQRWGLDPEDGGRQAGAVKVRQRKKNKAEKESQGQKIKRQREEPATRGAGGP